MQSDAVHEDGLPTELQGRAQDERDEEVNVKAIARAVELSVGWARSRGYGIVGARSRPVAEWAREVVG